MAISTNLPSRTATVAATADDQAITIPEGCDMLIITSDNATATNRTLTLVLGVSGQKCLLVNGSANDWEIADASTTALDGNVTFSAGSIGDSLGLWCDGVAWYETGRMVLA